VYFEQIQGELKALDELAKQFRTWKRFDVVDRKELSDVVATIETAATGRAGAVPVGDVVVSAEVQAFVLVIRSADTQEPLWSDKETIGAFSRYGGIKKLVDRLRERLEKN
jgi:hypothetical protein